MSKKDSAIAEVLEEFVAQIDSLAVSLPLAMMTIQGAHKVSHKSYDDFIQKNCKEEAKDGEEYILVPREHDHRFNVLRKRVRQTSIAYSVVPRSFQVSLVSSYDAFLGKLISSLFQLRPELLRSSDRTFTYSQLAEFSSISEARDQLLEKEVETLLRKSHSEQFDWLESKFAVKLRVDLPIWPTFIEVTERRNLFVHADGIVSSQYLKVCREQGVALENETKAGVQLEVPQKYFEIAHEAIFEIGVKLGQVLWRKLQPAEIEAADANLANVCYELLRERKFRLAQRLLDFACSTAMKHVDESYRLIFLVNRAQSYKWDGQNEKALEIVSSQDWSATAPQFQLAASTLRDEFGKAIDLMKAIGANGNPSKEAYKTWPLFREIRKTKEFAVAFEKIFGEPLGKAVPIEKKLLEASEDIDGEPEPPATVQ